MASRKESAFVPHDAEVLVQLAGQVAMAVNNALAYKQIVELRDRLSQEKEYLEAEINLDNRYEDIVGDSKGLRRVLKEIETVAPTGCHSFDSRRVRHRKGIACARDSSG